MRVEEKSSVKNSVKRLIFVAIAVLIQAVKIVIPMVWLNVYSVWISVACSVVTLVVVLKIYGMHKNAAFKMPWIMLILALPVMGLYLYLMFGRSELTRGMQKRFERIDAELDKELEQDAEVLKRLEDRDLAIANQARYICNYSRYPVYQNTDVAFYGDAAQALEAQKEAQRTLFLWNITPSRMRSPLRR